MHSRPPSVASSHTESSSSPSIASSHTESSQSIDAYDEELGIVEIDYVNFEGRKPLFGNQLELYAWQEMREEHRKEKAKQIEVLGENSSLSTPPVIVNTLPEIDNQEMEIREVANKADEEERAEVVIVKRKRDIGVDPIEIELKGKNADMPRKKKKSMNFIDETFTTTSPLSFWIRPSFMQITVVDPYLPPLTGRLPPLKLSTTLYDSFWKSACICVCGCNREVSYPTRRAHVAAKRALDETSEDQRVNKRQRSKSPTDQSEEWQEDGRFGAASPEPPQIEDTDFLYQDPPSSLSPRAIRVAEKTRQIITNRWRDPPSQPTPDVQEDACDDDYENEEEDLEWIRGEDGNSVHASDNISDDERESESEDEEDEDKDGVGDLTVGLSRTDIPSLSFWDRLSDDLAHRLMTSDRSLDESDLCLFYWTLRRPHGMSKLQGGMAQRSKETA
ncbi:hypothetical protein AGABI2DRAFT_142249 [Agaricus bisporus var. bisporus H97]|uniref:hypothetical protein n=1 Tax=Agaricus bisporus var. bisporus (strain H97 / ATCC MYA-4626 / FGSC 10389) TaxID=936046 RepID=UPI00029F6755|nr:hypothetical protein AGABI2DRAFT_142249 [Agaricus bisporus var. bisporus H97]EKV47972.1 hypothetical protein AGABI2DRAFT_142249 [Agaricus bisporus var. bisporus H97]